jgi:hypothetical protein
MALTIPTLPNDQSGGRVPRKVTPRTPIHDSLHMMEGLEFCWCLKPCCWTHLGRTADGVPRGACICRDCPCHSKELASGR